MQDLIIYRQLGHFWSLICFWLCGLASALGHSVHLHFHSLRHSSVAARESSVCILTEKHWVVLVANLPLTVGSSPRVASTRLTSSWRTWRPSSQKMPWSSLSPKISSGPSITRGRTRFRGRSYFGARLVQTAARPPSVVSFWEWAPKLCNSFRASTSHL